MDSPTIRCLRNEWLAIGTTPQSRAACHRLAQCEPVVADLEVDNLAELVAALSLASGRLSRNEAAEVVTAMLRSADTDALVPRAIIEALIPGVLALPRRFDLTEGQWCDVHALVPRAIIEALIPGLLALPRRFDLTEGPWCDLDAFYADAVSALWELTTRWSGTHRPYAAGDLLSGVRTRLRTLQSGTAPATAAAPPRWTPSRHRLVAAVRSSWPVPWPKRPDTASRWPTPLCSMRRGSSVCP